MSKPRLVVLTLIVGVRLIAAVFFGILRLYA